MVTWELIWENNIETYITICKTGQHWEFDTWLRAAKAGALWQPGGLGCRRVGVQDGETNVCLWPIHTEVRSQCCEVIILQFKNKQTNLGESGDLAHFWHWSARREKVDGWGNRPQKKEGWLGGDGKVLYFLHSGFHHPTYMCLWTACLLRWYRVRDSVGFAHKFFPVSL